MKKDDIIGAMSLFLGVVLGLIVFIMFLWVGSEITKEYLCTDKYTMDNPCFDLEYCCKVECGVYGLNFTGPLPSNGCNCECNENTSVSYCTGLIHERLS